MSFWDWLLGRHRMEQPEQRNDQDDDHTEIEKLRAEYRRASQRSTRVLADLAPHIEREAKRVEAELRRARQR